MMAFVAGAHLPERQAAIRLIDANLPDVAVSLVREPENPYDSNAVAVVCTLPGPHGGPGRTVQIGYIKAALAAEIAPGMDSGAMQWAAGISAVSPSKSGKLNVRLELIGLAAGGGR